MNFEKGVAYMNVFEAVKENVTTRQAAELYGMRIDRNGMTVCPFHNDKNPSLKVDRRFHCFGCLADGDVIDFVSMLYGLSNKDAVEKLAVDFGIIHESKKKKSFVKMKRALSEERRFQKAEQKCFRVFSDYLHLMKRWELEYAPRAPEEEWHPLFWEALQKKSIVGYVLDIFLYGDLQEKAETIVERGREVKDLERRISLFAAVDQGESNVCSRGNWNRKNYGTGKGNAEDESKRTSCQHSGKLQNYFSA